MTLNKKNTIIILDWDDTLFVTSWAIEHYIDINNPIYRKDYIDYFHDLDRVLYRLLRKMTKYGKVIIVSNAILKWIKISLSVLPRTSMVVDKYIDVVSARDAYKKKYPYDVNLWKKLVFKEIILQLFGSSADNRLMNIISVGDAEYEYKALVNLYNGRRILKTVRFLRSPDYSHLIDQLTVLSSNIEEICQTRHHMDLLFAKK